MSDDEVNDIRPMQLCDIPIVAQIASDAMPYPWNESVFRDCMKADYHAWVIVHGNHGFANEVLGFVVLLVQLGECQMLNIAVRPKQQRRGLGRQLLAYAIEFAEEQQARRMLFEVRASNKRAISLYQQMGCKQVGARREYYPVEGGREDAFLFYLDI